MNGAISPDGSWIVLAGPNKVSRIEVAPVEKISCNQPIQVDLPLLLSWIDPPNVNVDCTIYKPGRASILRQNWDLYLFPHNVLLGNDLTCSGDFQYQFSLYLANGNQVFRSTYEVDLPKCIIGEEIGGEGYELVSTLSNESGQSEYSTDDTLVLRFTYPD